MTLKEITASGLEAQRLVCSLLQRSRLTNPTAGIWEAADVQWWWRSPRLSDGVECPFWLDDDGPVAGILLTSWTDTDWQIDPLIANGVDSVSLTSVWQKAIELGRLHGKSSFDIPIADDDQERLALASVYQMTSEHSDFTGWMDLKEPPTALEPPEGFRIVSRRDTPDIPHPFISRNGTDVADRLDQCSLYDPSLDLWMLSPDGDVAATILFWMDPITRVGLVEPVRTEDDYQRRGLARTLLSAGLNKLADRGAERAKVSWSSEPAGKLYTTSGFGDVSTTSWYTMKIDEA